MGEYRWLSNFHLCSICYYGLVFPSTENAYQAAKVIDDNDREQFINRYDDELKQWITVSPRDAKKLGGKIQMRLDWDDIKLIVMRQITDIKFEHYELKQLLLATGDKELIEGNTWGDTFWGVCNGIGQNHLGKILMAKRTELKLFS
ncbi:MAG: NADAR family protein [Bacteroidales bacterium]